MGVRPLILLLCASTYSKWIPPTITCFYTNRRQQYNLANRVHVADRQYKGQTGRFCKGRWIFKRNGPYAQFGFESIEKQLWRNKQNDRPISDSEMKEVLSQLFKTDQWLPPVGHVSEDVTSHA
ncbi:hypothetical protein AVEN_23854-1 [Araneus ventricosus]|uniref:Uncharacterized protein n=1 Tax=Araneus ventricosus TaxID=182803 RepID=A0A4Y2QDQ3_ARAVE|nr:hypothetical protein AVEN_23854-1 [Araneus ventricosus]